MIIDYYIMEAMVSLDTRQQSIKQSGLMLAIKQFPQAHSKIKEQGMKFTHKYLGHSVKVKINQVVCEAIFAGWFLDVALVQMLDDEGHLTGEIHAVEPKYIEELPPLVGEAPAIYCPPH